MSENEFYEEQQEQSAIKTAIVRKYFPAWAKIIMKGLTRPGAKIGYLDLFAGRGTYEDGTESTPLYVLREAIGDQRMRGMLVIILNDGNAGHAADLQTAITSLPGIDDLRHTPVVHNLDVGKDITGLLATMKGVPTLAFVDPWGYKGVTRELIASLVAGWGSECIFFFNYNRINMAFNNPAVWEHVLALYGPERAERLRKLLPELSPSEREEAIVTGLTETIRDDGAEYVLPFTFKNSKGTKTSHHIVFVTKHPKGHDIMKGIMAKLSSSRDQGVPTLTFDPVEKREPTLFALTTPLDELADILLDTFAGKTLTMREVYEKHNVGERYIDSNYKDALKQLENMNKIHADPPKDNRRPNTFADHVKVTFPPKRAN